MAIGIKITLNKKLYLRDPQDSSLGKRIIKHSILLIDEIGFESFNFKKLAIQMESTEASVYRYFENKHMLLIYLVSWYWEWVSYLIDIKGTKATVKKTMGTNPRRIVKIDIDLIFPKEYDSKTKTILERAAYNCPVHHTLSENVEKNISFSYLS